MPADKDLWFDRATKTIQVISVVIGVVISVVSFNNARTKEAEAQTRAAFKPLVELRQRLYLEALSTAVVLADPEGHTADQTAKAKTRFRELYIAELSLVEPKALEGKMIGLAKIVDPTLIPLSGSQLQVYDFAHFLKTLLIKEWGIPEDQVN